MQEPLTRAQGCFSHQWWLKQPTPLPQQSTSASRIALRGASLFAVSVVLSEDAI